MSGFLEPGVWVIHPAAPDWGLGQVQSVVGNRVTVNFANVGKQLVLINHAPLKIVDPKDFDGTR